MRKTLTTLLVAGLMLPIGLATSDVHAVNIGNEGCTPGYWKNHTDNWEEATSSTTLFEANFRNINVPQTDTLLDALQYRGGSGLAGAERILMRAAAAAWLNAAHEGLGYPLRRYNVKAFGIVPAVNAAIASGNRQQMLKLARFLDEQNNLGCPLN